MRCIFCIVIVFSLASCLGNRGGLARATADVQQLRDMIQQRNEKLDALIKMDTSVASGFVTVAGSKKIRDEYMMAVKDNNSAAYHAAIDFNVLQHDIEFLKNAATKSVSSLPTDQQTGLSASLDSILKADARQ